jgi:hypothetical protein
VLLLLLLLGVVVTRVVGINQMGHRWQLRQGPLPHVTGRVLALEGRRQHPRCKQTAPGQHRGIHRAGGTMEV